MENNKNYNSSGRPSRPRRKNPNNQNFNNRYSANQRSSSQNNTDTNDEDESRWNREGANLKPDQHYTSLDYRHRHSNHSQGNTSRSPQSRKGSNQRNPQQKRSYPSNERRNYNSSDYNNYGNSYGNSSSSSHYEQQSQFRGKNEQRDNRGNRGGGRSKDINRGNKRNQSLTSSSGNRKHSFSNDSQHKRPNSRDSNNREQPHFSQSRNSSPRNHRTTRDSRNEERASLRKRSSQKHSHSSQSDNRRRTEPTRSKGRRSSAPQKSKSNRIQKVETFSLPKLLAYYQYCSRKFALDLVTQERVTINDTVIKNPNLRFTLEDTSIAIDGETLHINSPLTYIIFHKPTGLCPSREGYTHSVHSVIPNTASWFFPFGRLPKTVSGLTLLTNDAQHKNDESSSLHTFEKEYHIKVHRKPTDVELGAISYDLSALSFENREETQCSLLRSTKRHCWLKVVVRVGPINAINAILKNNSMEVLSFHRYRIGNITSDTLQPGTWRRISDNEIENDIVISGNTDESSPRASKSTLF